MVWSALTKAAALDSYRAGSSSWEVSKALGVPEPTVKLWVRSAGLAREKHAAVALAREKGLGRALGREVWDRISALYLDGSSAPEVAAVLGLKVSTVLHVLRRSGCTRPRAEARAMANEKISRSMRQHPCDPSAFVTLCPAGAWALGVLFGDGCIVRHLGKIRGVDVVGDEDVCRKVAAILRSSAPVRTKPGCFTVRFNSPEFAGVLSQYGLGPNKARTMRFPDLSSELLPHFARGFWDADGCVSLAGGKYLSLQACSASRDFMESLRIVTAGITGSAAQLVRGTGVHVLSYSCRNAVRLGRWLWSGSGPDMRGDRKYQRFEEIALAG